MRLVELTVTRLPGVEAPFSIGELAPNVTVVVGPNASGKSSLVRALRALWSSSVHAGQPVSLSGEFRQRTADGSEVTWRATRVGPNTEWERNGVRVDAPPTPPDHLLNSYLVSIETLMQSGPTDASIGDLLRREMTGGYDLAAAREQVTVPVRGHRRAAGHLGRAQQEYDALERNRNRLHERQQQRSDLVNRQAQAARAAAELPKYRRAITLRSQLADLHAERQALADMPAALAGLTGREADELASLRDEQVAADERRERAERQLTEARSALAATGLAQAELDEAGAHTLQAAADALGDLAEKAAENHRREAERRAELRAPWRRIGGLPTGPTQVAFDAETLDEAEKALGERLAAGTQLDAATAEVRALEGTLAEDSGADVDTGAGTAVGAGIGAEAGAEAGADALLPNHDLASAQSNLRNWLAAPPEPPRPRALLGPGLLLTLAAVLFLVTTVMALRGGIGAGASGGIAGLLERALAGGAGFYVPAVVALIGVVFGFIWLAVSAGRGSTGLGGGFVPGPDAALAERAFARTGARPPTRWDHEEVTRRLQELLAAAALRSAAEAQRSVTTARLEAARRRVEVANSGLKEADARLAQLAHAAGYGSPSSATSGSAPSGPAGSGSAMPGSGAPGSGVPSSGSLSADAPGAGFAAWLRDVRHVNDLTTKLRGLAASRRELEQQADVLYAQVRKGLAGTPFGLSAPLTESAAWREGKWHGSKLSASDELRTLTRRAARAVTERDRALADSRRAEADLGDAQAALASAQTKRSALLARCDVDATSPTAEAQLQALTLALPKYLETKGKVVELETLVADARAYLEDAPNILEAVLKGDVPALEQGVAAAEEAGGLQNELSQQIGALDEQVKMAEEGRELENARSRVERTGREVEEHLRRAHLNVAVAVLFDDVEQEHSVKRQPDVLKRAQEWFERFTHAAFVLEFEPTSPSGERLRARDTASGRQLSPDELSTGTRAQLLLALRVSHATHAEEGGIKLPFFLDEALTTADAGRFAEVAASLLELSQADGRQIIYLSARQEDAAAWRRVAESGAGEHLVKVIDLADVRTLGPSIN